MTTLRMPRPRASRAGAEARPHPVTPHDESSAGRLLEGELLDLYVAILIVVPLALFLKSLLF